MIKVKAFFGDWKEVNEEQARKFIKHMLNGITTVSNFEKKITMIEGKHLQGITVKELLQI
ncbi:MAG: hypothetical protein GYA02_17130 [Clostridiaceae bacterium]|nr:hypothetical protein [Clostridiaceae bacterium]